jgi:phage terminase large subunit-like protein
VDAGRRFGKTRLGVMECLEVAARGGRAYWVAPTYKVSEVGWRPLRQIAARIPGVVVNKSERTVTMSNNGMVTIRSADGEGGLRGEGLDFVVLDEAAYIRPEVWKEELRPSLSDRLGRALFISTPRGRNWFWEMYMRGANGEDDWQSWTFPTAANPYINPSEIEVARRELPEIVFRQEYLAEFVDMEGGVFRRVTECATADHHPVARDDCQYIAGVDVAASVDYTVVSVGEVRSRQMVAMDRFTRVDFPALEDRLAAIYARYQMTAMTIEANSIGQPVIDHLRARGLNVIPFTTTSATKHALVINLQAAFEHGNLRILDNSTLIGELLSFESKRTASGGFTYSAPDGMHDDCVMSLAILWHGMNRGRVEVIDSPWD